MKKLLCVLTSFLLTFGMADFACAINENAVHSSSDNDTIILKVIVPAEPKVGRHYNSKEEVDRIENVTVYPTGQTSATALKKVYVWSQIHYEVYRLRVGDPDYRVFLYDEYHTTWEGYTRPNVNSAWTVTRSRQTDIERVRCSFVDLIGML